MKSKIWNHIRKELGLWSPVVPLGIIMIIAVILIRMTGGFKFLEWMFFDTLLRLRPQEQLDERVVIVGIDEKDIQSVGQYPVPDGRIAELITTLETYEPLAIGLDIFKNVSVQSGGEELTRVLQENTNIFGIEKIFPPGEIPPPPSLSPEQVGFVDLFNDIDTKIRRYLLYTSNLKNSKNREEYKYSLALQLVLEYCKKNAINVGTGKNDPNTIMFNQIELPRITSNFGGYVGVNDGGLWTLINFRNSSRPFHVVSLRDVLNDKVDRNLLRGRIVLIGNLNASTADVFYTHALPTQNLEGQIYGVDYHAHVISQVLSTIIDKRPMLYSWEDGREYTWIAIWGFLPIIIGRLTQSVWKNVFSVGIAGIFLLSCGYIMLWQWGLWIPIAPSLLVLAVNYVSVFVFYQHDKFLRSQIKERQETIQYIFAVIHNGPLQNLGYVLQHMRTKDMNYERLLEHVEKIDKEIREIGEFSKLQALTEEESLRLGSGLILELTQPLHNLLYEVYSSTLERNDFEYFETLKVKIRDFEPIDDKYISMEDKRRICLFLEEALCNIGKHAQGVKCVQASGVYSNNKYKLWVKDNGCGMKSKLENKGTRNSKMIAKQLRGKFRRESVSPHGTICELSWTPTK
ncbi:MAG: CHASE2 domain-containing protein [Scytonematopsis contorta HA4267-MV1]|jgi:CHASE2 domain-containing sensor protein|nr:CHASE2 domain-containing protein [Scytonematopsis contorta HA4267-MV1]